MSQMAYGAHFPPVSNRRVRIDLEIHDGVKWVSLNDHHDFELGAKTLEQTQQSLRNHSVSSSQFDGDFITHTSLGNVTETIEVYIVSGDNVKVSEAIDRLQAAFMQSMYQIRRRYDADVEYWNCFPAEWSLSRGHVMIHNRRATMVFSVPRLPKVTREVFE